MGLSMKDHLLKKSTTTPVKAEPLPMELVHLKRKSPCFSVFHTFLLMVTTALLKTSVAQEALSPLFHLLPNRQLAMVRR